MALKFLYVALGFLALWIVSLVLVENNSKINSNYKLLYVFESIEIVLGSLLNVTVFATISLFVHESSLNWIIKGAIYVFCFIVLICINIAISEASREKQKKYTQQKQAAKQQETATSDQPPINPGG